MFRDANIIMSEPEAVEMVFACGPGMCDMDTATTKGEGVRIFAGGAEGMVKVGGGSQRILISSRRLLVKPALCSSCDLLRGNPGFSNSRPRD